MLGAAALAVGLLVTGATGVTGTPVPPEDDVRVVAAAPADPDLHVREPGTHLPEPPEAVPVAAPVAAAPPGPTVDPAQPPDTHDDHAHHGDGHAEHDEHAPAHAGTSREPGDPAADAPPVAAGSTDPGADHVPGSPVPPVAGAPVIAPGEVTGTLVRLWAEQVADDHDHDHADLAAASLHPWLETDGDAYALREADVAGQEDGARLVVELGPPAADGAHPVLRVLGSRAPTLAAGEVAYGTGSPDVFGVASAGVVHDVTIVLATPAGAVKDGMTTATMAAGVNGPVNTFWTQQTRGQRGFRVGRTHGWQSLSSTCADPFRLWDEVAAKVGFVAGPRKHLLVYIPPAAGCGAGLATVGSPDAGGRSWVAFSGTSIVAHELGHNLGLGHSNGLLCTGRPDGTYAAGVWQSGCAAHAYRDYYDVMGISWDRLGSLAAPQADALGVLRSTERLTTSTPVRTHLVPATSDGLRALRIDDPGGTYYVEYRVATGWDSWLASNSRGLDAGVLVHRLSPVRAREMLLLDGSVTSGVRTQDWRSALPVGGSLTTASGSTRIVVEAQSASGATVVVHRNGVGPAAVVAPADGRQVRIESPASSAVKAGTTVFSGVATAPEGTLQWEVWEGGQRRSSGWTATGANGVFDTWQVPVALPAGTFTFRALVPDYSDAESTLDPAALLDQVTVTVS